MSKENIDKIVKEELRERSNIGRELAEAEDAIHAVEDLKNCDVFMSEVYRASTQKSALDEENKKIAKINNHDNFDDMLDEAALNEQYYLENDAVVPLQTKKKKNNKEYYENDLAIIHQPENNEKNIIFHTKRIEHLAKLVPRLKEIIEHHDFTENCLLCNKELNSMDWLCSERTKLDNIFMNAQCCKFHLGIECSSPSKYSVSNVQKICVVCNHSLSDSEHLKF